MGMSTSSTQLVFFIAAMVIASGLVGLFAETITSMTDGVRSRGDMVYDKLLTDITIVNDPYNMGNDPVTIYVKNTGKLSLATTVDVLVDNGPVSSDNTTISVVGGGDWDPGDLLSIVLDINLSDGEHTIKIVVNNGVSDRFSFRI
ncbi:flagellar protein G [Thermoplasmatales archaeon ex4484_6]|nr:MAG: flagellar protein G [Thermoplasmatales archaeon ex4484_6]RLF66652.1 MAG: flagellar protein G [Thermoplasmata archaeon]